MRFRFNAPAHHVLTFGPPDNPVLSVHGGEEYEHPEGFGVPPQAQPVEEPAESAQEPAEGAESPDEGSAPAEAGSEPQEAS